MVKVKGLPIILLSEVGYDLLLPNYGLREVCLLLHLPYCWVGTYTTSLPCFDSPFAPQPHDNDTHKHVDDNIIKRQIREMATNTYIETMWINVHK